jgi:hypothetical protein
MVKHMMKRQQSQGVRSTLNHEEETPPAMTVGSTLLTLAFLSLAAVCAVGVWVGYQLFTTGFSAKTEPHALEVFIERQIRHLAIPIEKRHAQNPIPLSPDVMKESLAHFADHCAPCHANDGSGQTPIGMTLRYAHLAPSHLRAGILALEQRTSRHPAGLAISPEPRVTPVSREIAEIA